MAYGVFELAHILSHHGDADHTLAGHAHDSGRVAHNHDLLLKVHLASHLILAEHPGHQTSNFDVKQHRILHRTNEVRLKSIPATSKRGNPNYEKAFLPFQYVRKLIDPPDLA